MEEERVEKSEKLTEKCDEENVVLCKIIETEQEEPTEFLKDYEFMAKGYDFSIKWGNEKGKYVCADKSIEANYDILIESAIVVWPIKGCVDLLNLKFCENCLQIQPIEEQKLPEDIKNASYANSCDNEYGSNAKEKNKLMLNSYDYVLNAEEEIKSKEETKFLFDTSKENSHCTQANFNEKVAVTGNSLLGAEKIYFCSNACAKQALGEAAASLELEPCTNFESSVNDDNEKDASTEWVGGWMSFLSIEGLRKIRQAQLKYDASRNIPITIEAVARIFAKVCATTEFLHVHSKSLPLGAAFCVAWRPFQRLSFPSECKVEDIFDLNEAKRELENVLAQPIKEKLGEEIMHYMLSLETIQRAISLLIINSQALNIWGVIPGWNITAVRAAGLYTLHACFNHSCDPNCYVTSHDYNTVITVTTLRNIAEGEELTISYIPTHLNVKERRSLLHNFLFVCNCSRCIRESQNETQSLQNIS